MKDFENGLAFIEKDNRVFKRLKLLKWIENYFAINRFEVNKIHVTDNSEKLFVTELKKLEDLLPAIINYQVTNLAQIKSRIASKLDSLISKDRILKFVADLYNMFDDIILYDVISNRTQIKGKRILETIYNNFKINITVMDCHKKFMSKLTTDYKFT